jgi:hypothetical protein
VLLDLHPEPKYPILEVHTNDGVTDVGQLDTSSNVAKVHAARAVLASVVEAGYFAREDAQTFDFHYHFSDVDAWLDYMSARWTEAVIDAALETEARELLEKATGELVIRERVYAERLRARRLAGAIHLL